MLELLHLLHSERLCFTNSQVHQLLFNEFLLEDLIREFVEVDLVDKVLSLYEEDLSLI